MIVVTPPPSRRFATRHLPRFTGEENKRRILLTRNAGEVARCEYAS